MAFFLLRIGPEEKSTMKTTCTALAYSIFLASFLPGFVQAQEAKRLEYPSMTQEINERFDKRYVVRATIKSIDRTAKEDVTYEVEVTPAVFCASDKKISKRPNGPSNEIFNAGPSVSETMSPDPRVAKIIEEHEMSINDLFEPLRKHRAAEWNSSPDDELGWSDAVLLTPLEKECHNGLKARIGIRVEMKRPALSDGDKPWQFGTYFLRGAADRFITKINDWSKTAIDTEVGYGLRIDFYNKAVVED
jgi:hypothetical protein